MRIANVYTDTHFKQNTAVLTGKAVTNAVFTITVGGRAGRVQTEISCYGFNDW